MRRRTPALRSVGLVALACAIAASVGAPRAEAAPDTPPHPATPSVRITPGPSGGLGAWLLAGPFPAAGRGEAALRDPPAGIDEAKLAPRLGAATPDGRTRWVLASGDDGEIDVNRPLAARGKRDVVAYAAGLLHVADAGRRYLAIGGDDGLEVLVDGKVLLTREEARPVREDDDVVPLDLAAGDHLVVLKLHQHDGAWAFRARVVDRAFEREDDSYLELPGAGADDAKALAAKMSWVALDRHLAGDGYEPALRVELRGGVPLGVPVPVHARLARDGDPASLFDVDAGEVPPATGVLDVALPRIGGAALARIEDRTATLTVDVAGRTLRYRMTPRRDVREAIAHLDRALEALASAPAPSWLGRGTLESATNLRDRLTRFVDRGDMDLGAERDEAREIEDVARDLDRGVDPYARRRGPIRRAYRSKLDGRLSEYGVYVPPSYTPGTSRTYPLIVALHGLNGQPMEMIRWIFGGDDPDHDGYWEDRHVATQAPPAPPLPPLEAFVLAPSGRSNAMYRAQGEDDVLDALAEVRALYPIDDRRVTITGPSMGGSGAAWVPLRHPDVFAAAAPLCGYHSYFVRRDLRGKPLRPWERFRAEARSNALWAENGGRLPLYIVHGTLDLPEANSGVLIQRYEELHFSVKHEHPHLGHNVWQTTYEGFKGANWLLGHTADLHPATIHLRTAEPRDGVDAWLHVVQLARSDAWADVEAHATSKTAVEVTTSGARALHLDRDPAVLDPTGAIAVRIDGARVDVPTGAAIDLVRDGAAWRLGAPPTANLEKSPAVSGPFRDVFRTPLVFVYGASDPAQAAVNERVAHAWATHPGVDVHYEVVSDVDFLARGEPLANDRSLFLVGGASSNRVTRALESGLPVHVDGDALVLSNGTRLRGHEAGAAFVYPNPKRRDRYVAVVEGVEPVGTLRSLSLPDLLPDFVVYDETLAPARGQIVLGAGRVLAAGFFEHDWSWPAQTDDRR